MIAKTEAQYIAEKMPIARALARKQRQAMELMYISGLSQREVARQINVTEGNVSILHSRAVKTLRKMLIN